VKAGALGGAQGHVRVDRRGPSGVCPPLKAIRQGLWVTSACRASEKNRVRGAHVCATCWTAVFSRAGRAAKVTSEPRRMAFSAAQTPGRSAATDSTWPWAPASAPAFTSSSSSLHLPDRAIAPSVAQLLFRLCAARRSSPAFRAASAARIAGTCAVESAKKVSASLRRSPRRPRRTQGGLPIALRSMRRLPWSDRAPERAVPGQGRSEDDAVLCPRSWPCRGLVAAALSSARARSLHPRPHGHRRSR